jgi:hypothetical protein
MPELQVQLERSSAKDPCFLTLYTHDTAALIFTAAQVAEIINGTTIVEKPGL